jgi:hypothetical protein
MHVVVTVMTPRPVPTSLDDLFAHAEGYSDFS